MDFNKINDDVFKDSSRSSTTSYVNVRHRMSTYDIVCQHTTSYVNIRHQHTTSYVNVRHRMSTYDIVYDVDTLTE